MGVLPSAIALLLACAVFIGYALITARSQLTREMQSMADVVGINSAAAIMVMDPESAREILSALGADDRVRGAWLIDADGRLFANYRRQQASTFWFDRYGSPGDYQTKDGMVVSRPVLAGDDRVGTIVVSAGLDSLGHYPRRYGIIAGGVMLAALAVAVGLSTRFGRLISRPLLHLTETAARVSSDGDYSARAERENNDELGQLVDNFNHMLRQIDDRDTALLEVKSQLEDRVEERTEELEREVQIRAKTEQQLRSSLAEKEVMLKEIHHRVKNNLQVISSLLSLQSSHVDNDQAREALTTSQNRLRSIALVHEMFYQSTDLARIDMAPYLASATSYLLSAYGVDPQDIHVKVDCPSMYMAIDTAVPLGLIAHELMSNALKYAFPEHRRGEVRISLRPHANSVRLIVSDDGVGLPVDVRWDRPRSLGLQLVHSLTRQIKGHVELTRGSGSRFIVDIPDRYFDLGD